MVDKDYAENLVLERKEHEAQKYGRVPHPELAAYPHVYLRHSLPEGLGQFSEPINEPNN